MPEEEIDSDWTNDLICPYCGHKIHDDGDLEEEGTELCSNCEQEFTYQVHYLVRYSSQKKQN